MQASAGASSGIVIRRESGLPVYRQLVDQLRFLIGAGRYRSGEYLPTMRELAGELGLNLNTVNRAYRQLQRDGLIRSTPGKGATVVPAAEPASALGRVPVGAPGGVDAILSAAVERALAAGLTPKAIGERLDAILAALDGRVPPPPRIALAGGSAWRSRHLAERLSRAIDREVHALDAPSDEPPDVVVLPRYGAWCPERGEVPDGATVLEVPVLPDRDAVRRLVALEPGARVAVYTEDDGVARWLGDVAGAYAAPASIRRGSGAPPPGGGAEGEIAVVETDDPANGGLDPADPAVVAVTPAFAPTVAADLDRVLGR
jgi:GntR family transcriptional regulator